jgi:HlyD family secretion protein
MTARKKIVLVAGLLAVAGAAVGGWLYVRREQPIVVNTERIRLRDLEAIVSASGKVQPKRLVNISSDNVGRVVKLAVNEGDRIRKGQFLLQIDPTPLRTRVQSGTASLGVAEVTLEQMRQAIETSRTQLELFRQNLKRQQDLWARDLTTREALDRAINDVKVAESALVEREKTANAQTRRIQQERASLDSAQYDLSRVRLVSPIDGIVTRRNIQEGEMVMIGTMNNAGTVLLTLADMSVIQAEVEVDETNIPSVQIGQIAKITIDAIPDHPFRGHVTEIGNSPIQQPTSGGAATTTQATNFKVAVMLDEEVPEVRPGFTCTADITTARRSQVVAVPIPAVAVRELIYDQDGRVVKPPRVDRARRTGDPIAPVTDLLPGQTRKETEGVFVIREGRAEFVPLRVGIPGDKYFEVLAGLKENDEVITGPYNSVRGMADGDLIKVDPKQVR